MTEPQKRRSNLRTALIIASIAAVFFFGVIVDHLLGRQFSAPASGGPAAPHAGAPAGAQR